jgi:ribonucleotide reductase alpha subunit
MPTSFKLTKEIAETGLANVQEMIDTICKEKYCLERETTKQDVLNRVANIIQREGTERNYPAEQVKTSADMIRKGYFVPGGSILAGLGKEGSKSSLSNCYVVAIENDSIEAIYDAKKKMARTYSYRGGCGTDITVLRPAKSAVNNAAQTSSGAVSFMPELAMTTKTIGQCLAYDSLVLTKAGLKEIQYVTTDDQVWTKIGWVQVIRIIKNKKNLYKLTTEHGFSVRCSEDHEFQTLQDEEPVKRRLKEFNIGDDVVLIKGPSKQPSEEYIYLRASYDGLRHLTEHFAYMLGFLKSTVNGKYVFDQLENRRFESSLLLSKFFLYLKELTDADGRLHGGPIGQYIKYLILTRLRSILLENGLFDFQHPDTRIPELIYRSPTTVRCAYLSGVFDIIGGVSFDAGELILKADTPQLIRQLQILLMSVGITAEHNDDILRIKTDQMSSLYPALHESKLIERVVRRVDRTVPSEQMMTDQVASIEPDEENADVYDLTLEEENWFFCDGFYVKNSGRRGAGIITIDVRHPDIMSFIWSKADPHRVFATDILDTDVPSVSRANISVKLTDEFMQAVQKDQPWICKFPVFDDKMQDIPEFSVLTNKEFYDKHWTGDYETWEQLGGQLKDYTTYTAIVTEENRHRFVGHQLCNVEQSFIPERVSHLDYFTIVADSESTVGFTTDGELAVSELPLGEQVFKIPFARQIMLDIAEATCMRGDPGVMFIDHVQNNSYTPNIHPSMKVISSNPCITGDMLIAVADGRTEVPIKQLAEEGKDVPVFCTDEKGMLKVRMLRYIRKTRENADIVRVYLDNGMVLRNTPDHKYTTAESMDPIYAKDLVPGIELFTKTRSQLMKATDEEYAELQEAVGYYNCRVVKIEYQEEKEDVYNGMVDEYHNFFVRDPKVPGIDMGDTSEYIRELQCSEIPLSNAGNCLLGAHVVSKYVQHPWSNDASFDLDLWKKHSYAAVTLMNIISDINEDLHPLEEQRQADKFSKRLGIEFLGLTDALSMLHHDYDDAGMNFVDDLMRTKAYQELHASSDLAEKLGACPALHPEINKEGIDILLNHPYIQEILGYSKSFTLPIEALDLVKNIETYGLRNSALNTVGPTGSLALITNNASSGIEPIFALYQIRRTRVGTKSEYEIVHAPLMSHLLKEYESELKAKGFTLEELKTRFNIKEAYEVDYKDRIRLQSTVQKWIDGAISSTVNLPSTATPKDILDIYLHAWEMNLKGITVYRSGSLTGVIESLTEKKNDEVVVDTSSIKTLDDIETCERHRVVWNKAKIYIIVTVDKQRKPIEVFVKLPREVGEDKDGMFDEQLFQEKFSLWEAITRLTSLCLRGNLDLKEVIKQLKKSSYVMNDPMAIMIRVLSMYGTNGEIIKEVSSMDMTEMTQSDYTDICPMCKQKTYIHEGGCAMCMNPECKYTKCS